MLYGVYAMTIGVLIGVNAGGHKGWVTVKCRLCAREMDITKNIVYYCPKCVSNHRSYFCEADARRLKYKCPYCGHELEVLGMPKQR